MKYSTITDEYIAGFFDGEGCIYKRRRTHSNRSYTISIGQKDPEPLRRIQKRFGFGVLSQHKRGHWTWRIGKRAEVLEFLEAIYPCLIVKRAQASEVMRGR